MMRHGGRGGAAAPLLLPLLVAAVLLLCGGPHFALAQDNTAGATCQAVLKAGVYNTFIASASKISYSAAHQAACSNFTGYAFEQYKNDTSSAAAVGLASRLNTAAQAFNWAGNSASATSSSSTAFVIQTATEFAEVKTKAAAYRSTSCDQSSIATSADQNVIALSNFIEPAVYSAYTACINLYTSGVRVTQITGSDSKSLSLDIKFVPNQPGAVAYLTGVSMYPENAARCRVFKPLIPPEVTSRTLAAVSAPPPPARSSPQQRSPPPRSTPPPPPPPPPPSSADPFNFQLVPQTVYTVFCSLVEPANPQLSKIRYTDVNIHTSVSGTFHALLYNSPAPSPLAELLNRVNTLDNRVSTLSSSTDDSFKAIDNRVTTLSSSTDGSIKTLDTRISTVDNRVTTLSSTTDDAVKALDSRISTVDARVTTVDDQVTTVDDRVATLSTATTNSAQALDTRITALATSTEAAVKAVDSRVTQVDDRITSASLAADAAITAVDDRVTYVDKQTTSVDGRVSALITSMDAQFKAVNDRVTYVDGRVSVLITSMDAQFKAVNDRVTNVDGQVTSLRTTIFDTDGSMKAASKLCIGRTCLASDGGDNLYIQHKTSGVQRIRFSTTEWDAFNVWVDGGSYFFINKGGVAGWITPPGSGANLCVWVTNNGGGGRCLR